MKKRLTRVASIGLAAVMMFGLAACGSNSGSSTTTSAGSSASSAGTESSASSEASSDSYNLVEKGELHMATNAEFPPYESVADGDGVDDTGFEGIDIEVAAEIAKDLDLKLVVDNMDFSSTIAAVQGGKDDIVMAGMTVTPDRQKNIDFTNTYADTKQMIIVMKDSSIKSRDDLKNADNIGCQEGTTGYDQCSEEYGDDHVTDYKDGATAVQALKAGKADAVVIDEQTARQYVKANKDDLKILDGAYSEEDYAIGVSKDNPGLTKALNAELEKLDKNGRLEEIKDAYISGEE